MERRGLESCACRAEPGPLLLAQGGRAALSAQVVGQRAAWRPGPGTGAVVRRRPTRQREAAGGGGGLQLPRRLQRAALRAADPHGMPQPVLRAWRVRLRRVCVRPTVLRHRLLSAPRPAGAACRLCNAAAGLAGRAICAHAW
eukprot:6092022-Prymnesium_polylepis.1